MKLPSPRRQLRVHVAMTLDALHLADLAFDDLYAALVGIPLEEQTPIDVFDIIGYRATIRLFASLLHVEPYLLPMVEPIRDCIAREITPLERAAKALCFAVASLDEGLDTIDGADAWHGPLLAAQSVFAMMHGHLHCSVVRPLNLWHSSQN